MATESGYSYGSAAAILDVNESRLRYWAQTGFVGPSRGPAARRLFSFVDLVAVKAAKELTDRGFTTAQIRRALDAVTGLVPDADRPLDHLRVTWDGQALVIVDEGAAFEASGQRVFEFGLGDLARRASSVADIPKVAKLGPEADTRTAYEWLSEGLREEDQANPDEAAACYRKALKADPGLAAAHTNLGIIQHRRGDAAAARTCFEAALGLDPDQPEARYNLAHLIASDGDVELAAAELRRVLQTVPHFADAHYNLATALERLGGKQQAREHLLRYLELTAEAEPADAGWGAEARQRIQRLS